VLTSWSKSLSLVGITVASHDGIFKTSQNQIKKKTYENLIGKWNDDILTSTLCFYLDIPPHIQTISGYFQEKLMPKPKLDTNRNFREQENIRIR
jgi:hypothetical protein